MLSGKDYLNSKYVYAYSVDDGVGNIQAEGKGMIIAVGGKHGLPNPDPALPPVHVNFAIDEGHRVNFTKYGVCSLTADTPVNPDFKSFVIQPTDVDQCPVTFQDNLGRLYTATLKSDPPYPEKPTKGYVTCDRAQKWAKWWCDSAEVHSVPILNGRGGTDNYLVFPGAQPN